MNSQARIEHHHDIQESRAEVYAAEIAGRIPASLPTDQFDRGAMLEVERGRSNQPRPRSA